MSQRRRETLQCQDGVAKTQPLERRLIEHALRLRIEANSLPVGAIREAIIRRAEQAESGAQMTAWLRPPASSNNA